MLLCKWFSYVSCVQTRLCLFRAFSVLICCLLSPCVWLVTFSLVRDSCVATAVLQARFYLFVCWYASLTLFAYFRNAHIVSIKIISHMLASSESCSSDIIIGPLSCPNHHLAFRTAAIPLKSPSCTSQSASNSFPEHMFPFIDFNLRVSVSIHRFPS